MRGDAVILISVIITDRNTDSGISTVLQILTSEKRNSDNTPQKDCENTVNSSIHIFNSLMTKVPI